MQTDWRNYIDGAWVEGGSRERIVVADPATGKPIAEVARAVEADVDRAVAAARRAFERRVLLDMTPAERGRLMFAVGRELAAMTDEIAELECLDNGKTLANGRNEVALTVRYLEYYGGMADKLEGRQIPLGPGVVDYTVHAPYGVSAQIVPWNGPLPVGARSACCALVTGNTVVLKSPEDSPLSLIKFAQACERAGVPSGAFNLICGYGRDAGAALAAHPGVDHIVFTGSVETGRSVLRAAAERVVPCVMELGGKSAAIVHGTPTWRWPRSAWRAASSRMPGRSARRRAACWCTNRCTSPSSRRWSLRLVRAAWGRGPKARTWGR
jgi:aldehyde dehydrogenase (NAD+)